MINESKLIEAFLKVFGIDVSQGIGVFTLDLLKEFATELNVTICEDITKANIGKMPTKQEREMNRQFLRAWAPGMIKMMTDGPRINQMMATDAIPPRPTVTLTPQGMRAAVMSVLERRFRGAEQFGPNLAELFEKIMEAIVREAGAFYHAKKEVQCRVIAQAMYENIGKKYQHVDYWVGTTMLSVEIVDVIRGLVEKDNHGG